MQTPSKLSKFKDVNKQPHELLHAAAEHLAAWLSLSLNATWVHRFKSYYCGSTYTQGESATQASYLITHHRYVILARGQSYLLPWPKLF